jgi:hypothetical protein
MSEPASKMPPYEEQMSQDLEWAMTQGSLFFEDRGKVQESLRRITSRLNELGIPYAVVGGMAMYLHGFRRYTEDVDILVTKESAQKIYDALEGRGYVRPFTNSKNLRDTESGVKVEFLLSGGYPGDGKPKPVSFPDPAIVADTILGIRCINLPTLVQLKLASGMTAPDRLKDLADVQELIRMLDLPQTFSDSLDPYVRPKFDELWTAIRAGGANQE